MLTSSMINTFLRHHRCLHLSWGMLSCIWSSLSLNVSPMAEWIVLPPIPTAAIPDMAVMTTLCALLIDNTVCIALITHDLPVPPLPPTYWECCRGRLVVSLGPARTSSLSFSLPPSWSIALQTRPNVGDSASSFLLPPVQPGGNFGLQWCPPKSEQLLVRRTWRKGTMYHCRRLRSSNPFSVWPWPVPCMSASSSSPSMPRTFSLWSRSCAALIIFRVLFGSTARFDSSSGGLDLGEL